MTHNREDNKEVTTMRCVTVTEIKDFGGNYKPDPETEVITEMPKEEVMEFLNMQKALGKKVYEDDRKYWAVFQKAHDEIRVSTYWKE